MKELIKETSNYFQFRFKSEPESIFLSPGRINIIGEHVDYNDGYVLPAAIDKYICFAVSLTADGSCTIAAKDLNDEHHFHISDQLQPIEKMWANYILGVLHQYQEMKLPLKGFNIVFSSTIPVGAGLSSSAALECGFAYALNSMLNLGIGKEQLALIGQKAEHSFAGVMCGIMDQFASVFGKENKVIKLDCTTLEYDYHNADFGKYSLFLIDSKVKHTHLTSGYNDRRRECEQGLAILRENFPDVTSFRNCTKEQVEEARELLGETIFRRCHFVVREIQRVLDAVNALEAEDFKELGRLMYETHDGLSKEYEVSCEELDFLINAARDEDAIIGARMMGGGFGGCSINLVETDRQDEVIARISDSYQRAYDIEPKIYKVSISEGTSQYK
ncbi:MAG TPA: galactokinase [Flavobacterium sp.]|jgi:galactokinase